MAAADRKSKSQRRVPKTKYNISWFEEISCTENTAYYSFKASPTSANQIRKWLLKKKQSGPYFLFKTSDQYDPDLLYNDLTYKYPFLSVTYIRHAEKINKSNQYIDNEWYFYMENRAKNQENISPQESHPDYRILNEHESNELVNSLSLLGHLYFFL